MIDWHSHVLPGIDDGSKDVAESLLLLRELSRQGVDTVVATPHFHADDERIDRFIERRRAALDELSGSLTPDCPNLLLGAEVKYYQGIGRMDDLKALCIEGTNLLLLEMPMSRWTEYTVRELVELAGSGGVTVVLAHIERYLRRQSSETWRRLYDSGVLVQVNASFFTDLLTRKRALDMLSDGKIHFVGSDCHNMTSRPPHMDRAFGFIEKKLGGRFVSQMHEYGHSLLVHNK